MTDNRLTDSRQPAPRSGRLLAYLQLCRAPNVFTALADSLMGYAIVRPTGQSWPGVACLLLATACLYLSGMVLNDVFDIEQDRRERPFRPLPSGRVSMRKAQLLGWSLLVAGWLASWATGWLDRSGGHLPWLSGLWGTVLAVTIVGYNAGGKSTWCGPWLMGACRLENILMAMGAAPWRSPSALGGWSVGHAAIAVSIGVYVSGITWFARAEARGGTRPQLVGGALVLLFGWAGLWTVPYGLPDDAAHRIPSGALLGYWHVLLVILVLPIVRRLLAAIATPSPERVQRAVKLAIMSLVWWDATLLLLYPATHFHALAVLALFAPMLLLGRYVYST